MKAIIINDNNAVIVNVLKTFPIEASDRINFKITTNPLIEMSTSNNSTFLIDIEDEERELEAAYDLAESLVGSDGQITLYRPKNEKRIVRKYVKRQENKTD